MRSLSVSLLTLLYCFISPVHTRLVPADSAISRDGGGLTSSTRFETVQEALISIPCLQILGEAAEKTGLDSYFKNSELEITLFAPYDMAFQDVANGCSRTLPDMLDDVWSLKELLLYHVLPYNARKSDDFMAGTLRTKTSNNGEVNIYADAFEHLKWITLLGNGNDRRSGMILGNIQAGKSVIHLIDGVLLPSREHVWACRAKRDAAPVATRNSETEDVEEKLTTSAATADGSGVKVGEPLSLAAGLEGAFTDASAAEGLNDLYRMQWIDGLGYFDDFGPDYYNFSEHMYGSGYDYFDDDHLQLLAGEVGEIWTAQRNAVKAEAAFVESSGASIGNAVPESQDLMDRALQMPELRTWGVLVMLAGLADDLQDSSQRATVFAPTNEAFAALLSELGMAEFELVADIGLLRDILKYHLVAGQTAESAVLRAGVETLNTLHVGEQLRAEVRGSDLYVLGGVNEALITHADIRGGKAVMHVIDQVLKPPGTILTTF